MAKCPRNAFPRRSTVTRFSRDAFPGALPWQDSAAVCSRAAIRGKFCAPCIPKGAPEENRPFLARFARRASKTGWLLARCARHVFEKPRKPPLEDAPREYLLPGRGALCCTGPRIMHSAQILPSAAEQRERLQPRRRPLWAAEQGAGGFLSGGVAPPKRSSWRCGASSADGKAGIGEAPLVGLSTPIDSPNLENRHSRGGLRVGRRQGGAYQAAPPSEGLLAACGKVVSAPHKLCRQLLRRAVRALGTSFCRAHILPRHMACCPRARSPSIPLDEKVSPLVLFMLTIPWGYIVTA